MTANTLFGARAYASVGLETGVLAADPHRLIDMLYEGALLSIARAQVHMAAGHIAEKGAAVSRAVQIIDEGLKASLNLEAGGGLAQQLWQLYGYMARRLLLASLRNEAAGFDEVTRLLKDLRDAWRQIDQRANKPAPGEPRAALAA
ncbi:MAG: flagellar export chaperone FliS [Betaproteobacteria bacterium]|nr:flagellar export chaperone FliS [Betaproteobacteria bacterium]